MAKSRGRPRVPVSRYRGRRLSIRLTDAEYRRFNRLAERDGTTLSDLVRRLLVEHEAKE